jgi:uncharacterized protein YqjF (DUF2071 family)
VDLLDRIAPTRRPQGHPAGYQKWRSLLFLHWEVPAAALRTLVPPELEVDTFQGRAYVGLVPFTMRDVRPSRFFPPAPTARDFHELNVRTYVHRQGRDPGVWFFSLDATSSLAVLGARAFFHLPYWRARIDRQTDGERLAYRAGRLSAGESPPTLQARWELGEALGMAAAGTFEHFLVERYYLYARTARGRLLRGQVHHHPYPLRRARVTTLEESFLGAMGVERGGALASELWSEGVDVEIFPLVDA